VSRPRPPPDRTEFHHRFHKEEGYQQKKDRRILGIFPPHCSIADGSADAKSVQAQISLPRRQTLWRGAPPDSSLRSQKKSRRQSVRATPSSLPRRDPSARVPPYPH